MDPGPPIPPPTPPAGTPAVPPGVPPAVPPPLPTSTGDAPPTHPSEIPPGTPCPRCGYDLAGLSPSGRCPECGGANLNALDPYRFANASPRFVKRLHLGAMLTQIWAAILVVYIVGWFVYGQTSGFALRPELLAVFSNAYWIILLLNLVGWWLVSSPDPNRLSLAKRDRRRRVFRTLLVASLVFSVASFIGVQTIPFSMFGMLVALNALANLALIATLVASVVYVRSFARRFPSDAFARHSRVTLRICVVAAAVGLALYGTATLETLSGGGLRGWWYLYDLLRLSQLITGLVLYLPYIILFHLTRKELKGVLARM